MRPSKRLSGQALVEFALIFPLLFLLVMGLFDLGRAVFYSSTLNTAVREGTRYAIVQPDCDSSSCPDDYKASYTPSGLDCKVAFSIANIGICNEIKNKFFTGELSSSTITINRSINTTTLDHIIKIGIDFTFKPVTPGIALLGDLNMHVNSQMLMAPIAKP